MTLSPDEAPRPVAVRRVLFLPAETWPRILMPLLIGALTLGGWEWAVRVNEVPHYILPAPSLIWT
nr:ABC transporter permease [Rubritepida sp.]